VLRVIFFVSVINQLSSIILGEDFTELLHQRVHARKFLLQIQKLVLHFLIALAVELLQLNSQRPFAPLLLARLSLFKEGAEVSVNPGEELNVFLHLAEDSLDITNQSRSFE